MFGGLRGNEKSEGESRPTSENYSGKNAVKKLFAGFFFKTREWEELVE